MHLGGYINLTTWREEGSFFRYSTHSVGVEWPGIIGIALQSTCASQLFEVLARPMVEIFPPRLAVRSESFENMVLRSPDAASMDQLRAATLNDEDGRYISRAMRRVEEREWLLMTSGEGPRVASA